jgi:hypothetical protein
MPHTSQGLVQFQKYSRPGISNETEQPALSNVGRSPVEKEKRMTFVHGQAFKFKSE